MNDTIAAISTSLGIGAISIIRVSGNDSIKIVNNIFKGKNLNLVDSHTINYGYIIENEKIIDEVLVSVMRKPKTFTTEDVVEINCHGGITTTNKVLELLLLNGCRLAEPGEFTKRAFFNGRIDLLEAEAISDLINSKSEKARNIAINQIQGKNSNMIRILRKKILEVIANIEVNIDYPEYEDILVMTNDIILPKIKEIENDIKEILNNSENGKIIKEGIKTVIIGRPNVGKSSLLNNLLDEEKAIVTNIAGTTRDIVEGQILIDGILLNLIDTAGIRKTDDIVEKMGVEKSYNLINQANLIIYILNNNEEMNFEDIEILNKIKDKNYIIVVNKMDLDNKLNIEKLSSIINQDNIVMMCINQNIGIDNLKKKIKNMFNLEMIETEDYNFLTNARSISILRQCLINITSIYNGIEKNMPIDMVEIDIKKVWELLGEIIGETYQDELINQLFSQFCLGK
ncbi:MAG: tRNA uridine-5-carboxymethylaminomethyl(34) synthesis GTPase MnmE [Bacilli bacterium]|nr:tRNA uridine-5-carboxymethylaminomethyl(34) synthesis GTPase MnmE [Bacilli bacterium]